MQKLFLIIISAVLLLLWSSCGKDGKDIEEQIKTDVTYAYGKFNQKNAMAMATVDDDGVTITVEDFYEDKGHLYVRIDNYTGPGTYTFGEHVTVYGEQDNSDDYWMHFYYNFSDTIYAPGSIKIKTLTDEKLVFEMEGKLYHVNGETGERTETTVKASADANI